MAMRVLNKFDNLGVMRLRLFVVAFCGPLVLAADVCSGLPAGPAETTDYLGDLAHSMSFRLRVKAGGPAFRITVRSLLHGSSNDDVHAGDIEVSRCSDGRRLQLLAISAGQPINFGRTFRASDVNFDGYLDFSVLGEFGAKWGRQLWWVYEPARGRFVRNELTTELGQLRNNGYQIDSKRHEIRIQSLMAGCPSLETRYHLEGTHLIKIHEEIGKQVLEPSPPQPDLAAGVPCTVTFSDLVAGTMRVTRVGRFVDEKPLQ